jgi:NAD(P)-dependent dehydrogenase (short-subunit alcohol dehydrogenase family)
MAQSQKTVLITGATSGIGRHAALHLARLGHHIIASGRSGEALASLKKEAREARLDVVLLDVTSDRSIREALAQVDRLTNGAGVDVLINNAGFGTLGPIAEMTDADVRAQFDTNVFGLLNVTRAVLPAMQARRSGRVINVSSIGGKVTMPFMGPYTATKHAVEALSDAMRQELAAFGIDVVVVEPGAIRTNFTNRSMDGVRKYRSDTSPYAPIYRMADRMSETADRLAVDPIVISRVLARAVASRRPRARYIAPFSGRLAVFFGRALPTRLVDWVMRQAFGLTSRKLLAGTSAPATRTALPAA